jgi:polyisoprenyl-phosphate glycosyltransferase
MPDLSIVLPAYNEEKNAPVAYAKLREILESQGVTFEIVFVDDGSSDSTASVVGELCKGDGRLKLLRLSRNFGHQMALTAGLAHSKGRAVITMDADMQHPVSVIPEMLRRWRAGDHIVNCIREYGSDVGFFKRFTSLLFYKLLRFLADIPVEANVADFRLMDRKVVDLLNGLEERSRYLRGLTTWVGFRSSRLHYQADPRFSGVTKYSFKKMCRLASDGVTNFSVKPLRLSAYLGLAFSGLGVFYGFYILYGYFVLKNAVPGWTSMILVILIFSGLHFLGLGLLGLYLGKVYEEVKRRPLFIVMEKIGFGEQN